MYELGNAVCPARMASAPSAARRRRQRRYQAAFLAGAKCVRGGAPGLVQRCANEASDNNFEISTHSQQDQHPGHEVPIVLASSSSGEPQLQAPLDANQEQAQNEAALEQIDMTTGDSDREQCAKDACDYFGFPSDGSPTVEVGEGGTFIVDQAHSSFEVPAAASVPQQSVSDESQQHVKSSWVVAGQSDEDASGSQWASTSSAVVAWLLEQMHCEAQCCKRYVYKRVTESEEQESEAEVSDSMPLLDADTLDTIYEIVGELSGHSQRWVQLETVYALAIEIGRTRDVTTLALIEWCSLNIMYVDKQRARIRFLVQPMRPSDE